MNDIVNLLVNNGVAVVIVAYFLYKDNKFNNELVKSLTELVGTIKEMRNDIKEISANEESNKWMYRND